jgi:outer membrane protein TolC
MTFHRCVHRVAVLAWACGSLGFGGLARADLGFDEATRLAREQAPALVAQQAALAGATAAVPAAGSLPDPRLSLGVDNLPISGADRFALTRDFMTMQRLGLMQEVPNAAKRLARGEGAAARAQREKALLAVAELAVQREASLAWLALYFAQQRAARLGALVAENQLLISTLEPRIAAGKAMPADRSMARQEALALADRQDDARRDIAKARASLRRWVGARADEPLGGEPPAVHLQAEHVRAQVHEHAEIAPYAPMLAMAQAELDEARAERRGDWAWEVVYSRRGPAYGDMVSFQVSMDLPWNKGQRQEPQISAKLKELDRIQAEREDMLRRHGEELEGQLADLAALDAQHARLQASGLPLATERVALSLASYEAGRADLGAVLVARREAVELRLRLIDLDAQRLALRVRLSNLVAR